MVLAFPCKSLVSRPFPLYIFLPWGCEVFSGSATLRFGFVAHSDHHWGCPEKLFEVWGMVSIVPMLDHLPGALETLVLLSLLPSTADPLPRSGVI